MEKLPNLESLVAGFTGGNLSDRQEPEAKVVPQIATELSALGDISETLWDAFLKTLEVRDRSHTGQKIYNIDADIVETINQCKFKSTTTHVINSILRVFLISNLQRMVEMRKERPASLFDNYLTPK